MKPKLLVLIGALLLAAAVLPFIKSRPKIIAWHTEASTALDEAREEGTNVITFLYTDWCSYCRQMEQTTFKDPLVIEEMASDYTWLRLNAEKDPDGISLRQEFDVNGYPTYLILDEDGNEVDRLQGYIPSDQFISSVKEQVSSPTSFGRVRQKAEELPEDIEAQYQLAEKYVSRQMFGNAAQQYTKIVDLDPENSSGLVDASLFYLAESHIYRQRFSDATTALDSLKERFPESEYASEGDLMTAEILLNQGEEEEAKVVLTRFLDDNPEHAASAQIRDFLSR
jgi:thioredoxin-like negative regulator of GroEL